MSFQNPTGYWEHSGSFCVELISNAPTDNVPKIGAIIRGNVVDVRCGRIKQVMGGIQLYAFEQPFFWGYAFIKAIRRADGSLIWLNWYYNEDGSPKEE